jgi:hypothetical protein
MIVGPARAASAPVRAGEPAVRRLYAVAAAGFVLFAIWGSLFPFNFQPASIGAAAARLPAEWTRERTAAWSLTDLTSNVLLFVPIGLLFTATLTRTNGRRMAPAAFAHSSHRSR